jgi:hypothetical protein
MKLSSSISCIIEILSIAFFNTVVDAQSPAGLSAFSQVSTQGIGAIKIGMTIAQAAKVAKIKLITENSDSTATCVYYQPAQKSLGVSFMVTDGIISRIDITNPQITTLSGAKIGNSENRIRAIYGNRIQTKSHKYLDRGHYLIFVPRDLKDRDRQIIFETDGSKIINWRVGKAKEVAWVEGCS